MASRFSVYDRDCISSRSVRSRRRALFDRNSVPLCVKLQPCLSERLRALPGGHADHIGQSIAQKPS